MDYPAIDHSWTLFLDRDGVINRKIDNGYVLTLDDLELLPGAVESVATLSQAFGRTVIVTNQQCVGKGLLSHEVLAQIHLEILDAVISNGGYIDEVYYCPDLAYEYSHNRKPMPGMGLQAKADFPDIDFKKSIMVGDSASDIEFGKTLGMLTVRIAPDIDAEADFTHSSLQDFLLYLDL